MRRNWLLGGVATLSLLTAGVLVLSGCGGSGGPVSTPETGPSPSVSTQFLQLLPASQQNAAYLGESTCATCHPSSHTDWLTTKHSSKGVACEQCHGPGSVHAAAPAKTNILTFPLVTRAIVCGQCHGPTHEQFAQSRHSGAVEAVVEEAVHNPNQYGRTCFRCHSAAFRDQFVDTPLAKGKTIDEVDAAILNQTNLTTDHIVEIAHATKESASCSTCHNPHKTTANLDTQGGQGQLRRRTSVLPSDPGFTQVRPGAPVKEYTTFDHECASCHNGRGANGADSAFAKGTARPNMHDSNQYNMLIGFGGSELPTGPAASPLSGSHSSVPNQCAHCHVPQRRHTFTVSYDQSCQPCHTTADAAARANTTREAIQNKLLALRTRLENWALDNKGNARFWDYTTLINPDDVLPGNPIPDQNTIPIQIKRARHNYYFVLRDKSYGIHNLQYANYLLKTANDNLDAIGARAATITAGRAAIQSILNADLKRATASETRTF